MTVPKRLAPFRIRFFDGHLGIAKTNDFFFALGTCFNNRLFSARYLTFGLVALHLGFINFSHESALC